MSVINQPITTGDIGRREQSTYLNHSRGIKSWLLTLDHKRIGIMYMVAVLGSFFIGGMFAIAMRTELIAPGPTLNGGADSAAAQSAMWEIYNHMFTLHGAVMVFMFIIPAVPAVLGNFMLPMMIGAKDVAFPRLNLLSFYCWIGGAVLFLYILLGGTLGVVFGIDPGQHWWLPVGLDTGWTFYTPLSTSTPTGVVYATLGVFILGFSSILTGVNFIASIHMLRPRNMGWFRLPLFLWSLYATAVIQILATPVLAITLLLLICERVLGVGIFDPHLGGDPVLYQHFFWFYSHPAVYIMVIPAMGVVSEIISVFSRKHIFGYKFIAFSSLAIALFGFLVWGHHMFASGQSAMLNTIFSLLSMVVAIPSAIKVFNWLSTLYRGSVRLETPMLYAMGFIWMFTIGGLTGLFLAAISTDLYFHATYFVVAHFHYVMVGSMLFAFLGGMYYWFPKMFGKMCNEKCGKVAWALVFIGFNMTFFVQFIAGSQGMPRRYADYPPKYWPYHFISTIGSYILAVGLFTVLGNWIHGLSKGRPAPANPWGGNQLEWHTASPPPMENFHHSPEGSDPYDFRAWKYDPAIDGYVYDEQAAAEAAAAPLH